MSERWQAQGERAGGLPGKKRLARGSPTTHHRHSGHPTGPNQAPDAPIQPEPEGGLSLAADPEKAGGLSLDEKDA